MSLFLVVFSQAFLDQIRLTLLRHANADITTNGVISVAQPISDAVVIPMTTALIPIILSLSMLYCCPP